VLLTDLIIKHKFFSLCGTDFTLVLITFAIVETVLHNFVLLVKLVMEIFVLLFHI